MTTNILTARWETPRQKAAMKRSKLSYPVATAIAKGIITPETTFFDFGCGRGDDVRLLIADGYQASGFDPYYAPESPKVSADVVGLNFVLGVIENPTERQSVLAEAWSLANVCLLVTSQVQHSRGTTAYGDGFLTKWRTFAKYWTEPEWRQYVESVTGGKARRLGKGILCVSRPVEQAAFVSHWDTNLIQSTDLATAA